MALFPANSGALKIYRFSGHKSSLTNPIITTDMTTNTTFKPKAIMVVGHYNSSHYLSVEWNENESDKEAYMYDSTAYAPVSRTRIASINDNGFTINTANYNNFDGDMVILAVG